MVGIFINLYIQKNSKRYKVENEYGEYFRELPDDYSPAVAGTLLSKRLYPESRELFATLLDLVRKGYLELEESENRTTLVLQEKDGNSLTEEEKFILNWYIRELGDGSRVTLEDIEEIVKIEEMQENSIVTMRDGRLWYTQICYLKI